MNVNGQACITVSQRLHTTGLEPAVYDDDKGHHVTDDIINAEYCLYFEYHDIFLQFSRSKIFLSCLRPVHHVDTTYGK